MPPIVDNVVIQFFAASRLSAAATTAPFELRRVFPISIYVEGNGDGGVEFAESIKEALPEFLEPFGYRVVGEWGPFYGSYFTTLFAQSREEELGRSFDERLLDIARSIANLTNKV